MRWGDLRFEIYDFRLKFTVQKTRRRFEGANLLQASVRVGLLLQLR